MDSRYVTIATYHIPHDAEIAASFLEEQGIPAVVRDDNTNPMGGGYVEIRLQVPEQNADDALELLDGMTEEGVDLLEDIDASYETEHQTAASWKDVPAEPKPVICPRCLSINAHKPISGPVPGWLNALLLGLPNLIAPARLQCRGCGAIFKP